MNIDIRIAAILTNTHQFVVRCRRLMSEAARAGDVEQVAVCRMALHSDDPEHQTIARECVAATLASAEGAR